MMKKMILFAVLTGIIIFGCAQMNTNPFFEEWNTPFQTPPFEKIKTKHFMPAFEEAMRQEKSEVDAIVNNTEEPTFENTIEALDYSGAMMNKVGNVFGALRGALTNDDLQAVAAELAPLRAKHRDDINLNEGLFQRVKAVYEKKDQLDLNPEQAKLLEDTYLRFVRNGANLEGAAKEEYRAINEELASLTLKFGDNVLAETNKFELVIDNEDDLDGLPENVIAMGAEAAKAKGYEGKWVYTIHRPSMYPFLTYSKKRDLREKLYKAYTHKGDNNDALDNKKIAARIAELRVKRAHLLGYESHADYVLERRMAKNPESVYALLNQVWIPALKVAKQEVKDMQAIIDAEGGDFKLEPWDWWYYAEKVKKAKYDLDESLLRPYFQMENVRQGAFMVANKLYGITFEERDDIPVYHEDVTVYEVKEADGSHIGILYTDYFPRASKRGGAWMSSFRKQYRKDGENITPLIYNCGNFSKPTGDKPALLSLDETLTLFHEFGHGLHGLLSNCTYYGQSGTAVVRDFVELPSQIMEHWATEPEVLKMYAKHYETGEPIPDELIAKMKKAQHFNQGFVTVEFVAAAYLDMDWHTITEVKEVDTNAFEKASMDKIGLIDEIVPRYRSTYYQHIFSGGYSAGYYSYLWAEVLDADAFEAFKETSLFDQATAKAFRDNVVSRGGTADAMDLYIAFRGKKPSIEPLLKGRGLK